MRPLVPLVLLAASTIAASYASTLAPIFGMLLAQALTCLWYELQLARSRAAWHEMVATLQASDEPDRSAPAFSQD